MLRSELQRPGQSAVQLGDRVKLMVRAIANDRGRQQEPEVFYDADHSANIDDFSFVGSIGRERFQMTETGAPAKRPTGSRSRICRSATFTTATSVRFDLCPHGTAELARRALATLALSSDDPISVGIAADKSVSDCDRLAASPLDMDRARPPGTGVVTDKLDAEAAIDACNKAVDQNPRVARYLYNLGRAYQKLALRPGLSDDERKRAIDSARLALTTLRTGAVTLAALERPRGVG